MCRRIIFVFAVALTTVLSLRAVERTYHHKHFDDHNGMSQWHVTKMLQDKRGFMWFSTWNGLNRFDGYEFSVFKSKPGDGNNIISDRIRNMLLGDDGNIYCVNGDVVWRFNLTTYQFETIDSVLQERYLARINTDKTVYKERRTVTIGDLSFSNIRQMLQDPQRNTWLMEPFGISKVSPIDHPAVFLNSVPRCTVRAMYRDNQKRIWIGVRDENAVIVVDSTAQLIGYLGCDGRLHSEFTQFYAAYSIYQQKNGTIWIGSKPHGMFRLQEQTPGQFLVEHLERGTTAEIRAGKTLNSTNVYYFTEDKKGRLWIATQGGGLNLLENPSAPVDRLRFRNPENTFSQYPKGNCFMRRLLISGDSLMLATTTEGFIVIDNIYDDLRRVSFTLHQRESQRVASLSCSAVMDMLIDRKGRLFISSESGGVNMLLTKNMRAKQFDFQHFTIDNGMGSDAALAMTEVGDEILIQCNNQVTRLNVDLNRIENFNDMFFSINSRFSDAEPLMISGGQWLLTLEDGVLVMPEPLFHQRNYVPRIAITSYDLPGVPPNYAADISDTIRLSPSQRDITISYAALDYSADNSNIKYVTRLSHEGHWWQRTDSIEWTAPSVTRSQTFYNLSPGKYVFEVISTNAEGLWVDNARRITIIVEPAFWETWWAWLLYVVLFAAIVTGITYTYLHIKQLEQQREENLRAYLTLLNAQSEDDEKADGKPLTPVADQQVVVASPIINEEDDAFMRRLIDFVEENMGNSDIGLDEMASATATSRSSLNRKTKSLLGVTPADFLKEARMKRAQQQLSTTSRSVNEIAYNCGFSDPKYFSKCFKQTVGLSPSEYRAQIQA